MRLTIRYIHQLAEMVESVESPVGYNAAKVKEEKAKVIIRCHGELSIEYFFIFGMCYPSSCSLDTEFHAALLMIRLQRKMLLI